MACLAIVQQEQGLVSAGSRCRQVADVLGMPPIAVHEVTTFYNMYNQAAARHEQAHRLHQPAVRVARWRRRR